MRNIALFDNLLLCIPFDSPGWDLTPVCLLFLGSSAVCWLLLHPLGVCAAPGRPGCFLGQSAAPGVWTALELLSLSPVPVSLAYPLPFVSQTLCHITTLSLINWGGKLKGNKSPLRLLSLYFSSKYCPQSEVSCVLDTRCVRALCKGSIHEPSNFQVRLSAPLLLEVASLPCSHTCSSVSPLTRGTGRWKELEGGIYLERWVHEGKWICCRQTELMQTSAYYIYGTGGLSTKKMEKWWFRRI